MYNNSLDSNATIEKIIRINETIRKHLSEEEDCRHSLKSIIQEAFSEIDK